MSEHPNPSPKPVPKPLGSPESPQKPSSKRDVPLRQRLDPLSWAAKLEKYWREARPNDYQRMLEDGSLEKFVRDEGERLGDLVVRALETMNVDEAFGLAYDQFPPPEDEMPRLGTAKPDPADDPDPLRDELLNEKRAESLPSPPNPNE